MKKKLLLPVAALCLVTLFSCGGDGSSSNENPASNTETREKLVIGLECDYAPFNWAEQTSNEYTLQVANVANTYADGYDIQIAKLLGEKLNMDIEIMQIEWDSLITELQFDTIDAVIAGMTDTEERRLSIDFTDEYYHSELVLITSKAVADSYNSALSATEFGELVNGKVIVSQDNTVTNDVIDTFAESYGAIHANPVETFAFAATDVSNGSAFAMTAELPVAQSIVASFSNLGIIHINQEILGAAQAELGVSIGIRKNEDDLKAKLNQALSEIDQEQRVSIMQGAVERSTN